MGCPVDLEATHQRALEIIPLEVLETHAVWRKLEHQPTHHQPSNAPRQEVGCAHPVELAGNAEASQPMVMLEPAKLVKYTGSAVVNVQRTGFRLSKVNER